MAWDENTYTSAISHIDQQSPWGIQIYVEIIKSVKPKTWNRKEIPVFFYSNHEQKKISYVGSQFGLTIA